jgi:hypothetical protein
MGSNYIDGRNAVKIAIGIAILALLFAGSADAISLTVNASDGGADYTSIQDAIIIRITEILSWFTATHITRM